MITRFIKITRFINWFLGLFTGEQASVSTEASESPKSTAQHAYTPRASAIPSRRTVPKPQKPRKSQYYRRGRSFYSCEDDCLITDLLLIDMLYELFPGEDYNYPEDIVEEHVEDITEVVSETEGDSTKWDSPEPGYTPPPVEYTPEPVRSAPEPSYSAPEPTRSAPEPSYSAPESSYSSSSSSDSGGSSDSGSYD